MTELESLRDLISSEGWQRLGERAAIELRAAREKALAGQVDPAKPFDASLSIARYQAANIALRLVLEWPAKRIAELEKQQESAG